MRSVETKRGVTVLAGCLGMLGCQTESPVVGESLGSDAHEVAGATYQTFDRVGGSSCIPYNLDFDRQTGMVACTLSQVDFTRDDSCGCDAPGLGHVYDEVALALQYELRQSGECDAGEGTPPCDDLCVCERRMATGADSDACQNDTEFSGDSWCIVDPAQGFGDPELVLDCPSSKPNLLRFGNLELPEGAALYLSCITRTPSVLVGDLGEPCVPAVEVDANFSGFTSGAVMVETRPRGCNSEVCLVQHFQGRVSCPYGQTEEQARTPPELAASRLREEAALLRQAREELGRGALDDAEMSLQSSLMRFPDSKLQQEREALTIELLVRRGLTTRAASAARAFLQKYPHSPHAARVRRALGEGGGT